MICNLSKNSISYCFLQNKNLFGLVLSSFKGWGIICFEELFFLIKNNELHWFLFHNKSFYSFLKTFLLGFQKGYFQYLLLKGMGYKFISIKNNLIIKFGFSHRIIYLNYLNIYCKYINKYMLHFESRSFWDLKKINLLFQNIKKNNVYKKKGIFFKGHLVVIKTSNKKSKF